jgi:hypothetical protein
MADNQTTAADPASARSPRRGSIVSIVHDGKTYSRKGLARHLAGQLGSTVDAVDKRFRRRNNDVAAVIASYDPIFKRGGTGHHSKRPITYEGRTYPSQRALAQHLAERLNGTAVSAIEQRLSTMRRDVAAVLASFDRKDRRPKDRKDRRPKDRRPPDRKDRRPPQGRPVVIDGLAFPSITAAARHLGLKPEVFNGRLRSRNYDVAAALADFRPGHQPEGHKRQGRPRPVVIDGVSHRSVTAAARHLADKLGVTARSVELRFRRRNNDVAAVLASYQRVIRPRPTPKENPHAPKSITYEGRLYPSQKALAQHLASVFDLKTRSIETMLSRDNAAVVARFARRKAH